MPWFWQIVLPRAKLSKNRWLERPRVHCHRPLTSTAELLFSPAAVHTTNAFRSGPSAMVGYEAVMSSFERATGTPAADFINARPSGDTQLTWLRLLRSTSSVRRSIFTLTSLERPVTTCGQSQPLPKSTPARR